MSARGSESTTGQVGLTTGVDPAKISKSNSIFKSFLTRTQAFPIS